MQKVWASGYSTDNNTETSTLLCGYDTACSQCLGMGEDAFKVISN